MKFLLLIMLLLTNPYYLLAKEVKVEAIKTNNSYTLIKPSDIKEVRTTTHGRFDQIELRNGEIYYDNEIESIIIKTEDNRSTLDIPTDKIGRLLDANGELKVKLEGGDGSGGG